jgi:hypothetical protein
MLVSVGRESKASRVLVYAQQQFVLLPIGRIKIHSTITNCRLCGGFSAILAN